jgi:hypothetical protein
VFPLSIWWVVHQQDATRPGKTARWRPTQRERARADLPEPKLLQSRIPHKVVAHLAVERAAPRIDDYHGKAHQHQCHASKARRQWGQRTEAMGLLIAMFDAVFFGDGRGALQTKVVGRQGCEDLALARL